jgi:hypothetical protein
MKYACVLLNYVTASWIQSITILMECVFQIYDMIVSDAK